MLLRRILQRKAASAAADAARDRRDGRSSWNPRTRRCRRRSPPHDRDRSFRICPCCSQARVGTARTCSPPASMPGVSAAGPLPRFRARPSPITPGERAARLTRMTDDGPGTTLAGWVGGGVWGPSFSTRCVIFRGRLQGGLLLRCRSVRRDLPKASVVAPASSPPRIATWRLRCRLAAPGGSAVRLNVVAIAMPPLRERPEDIRRPHRPRPETAGRTLRPRRGPGSLARASPDTRLLPLAREHPGARERAPSPPWCSRQGSTITPCHLPDRLLSRPRNDVGDTRARDVVTGGSSSAVKSSAWSPTPGRWRRPPPVSASTPTTLWRKRKRYKMETAAASDPFADSGV